MWKWTLSAASNLSISVIALAHKQAALRARNTQRPLVQELLGKDLVREQRRTFGHAPGAADRAEAPAFVAER